MAHLGTQISALADGQLDSASAERALCHVAACRQCADDLAATRAASRAVAMARNVPVARDLASRLLALGTVVAQPPTSTASRGGHDDAQGVPAVQRSVRRVLRQARLRHVPGQVSRTDAIRRSGARPARVQERAYGSVGRRGVSVWTVAAAAVGIGVVWLFVVGEEPGIVPDRRPGNALALLAAVDSVRVTESTMAQVSDSRGAHDVQWGVDVDLVVPDGYGVVATHEDAAVVELDLDGPDGVVVVMWQRGRLDGAALEGTPIARVGDHEVHVLSNAPWHGVWQSGDAVVDVVAGGMPPVLETLVAAYPEIPFDDGVTARISRGWQTVAGAWKR